MGIYGVHTRNCIPFFVNYCANVPKRSTHKSRLYMLMRQSSFQHAAYTLRLDMVAPHLRLYSGMLRPRTLHVRPRLSVRIIVVVVVVQSRRRSRRNVRMKTTRVWVFWTHLSTSRAFGVSCVHDYVSPNDFPFSPSASETIASVWCRL
jgi:hypothetical protein